MVWYKQESVLNGCEFMEDCCLQYPMIQCLKNAYDFVLAFKGYVYTW